MKKMMMMLLIILSMLCLHSCRDSEEVTDINEEKMLDDYMEMLKKEFNLRMNKGAYYVKEEQLVAGNLIHNPYSYVLYSYNIPRYKSEFFYNRDVIHVEYPPTKSPFEDGDRLIWPLEYEALKDIPFFNKTTKSRLLIEIIDYYGVRPYLWSSLIYDKSKGNDFEKIEKILKKHGIKYDEKIPVGVPRRTWVCGTMLKESNDESFEKNLISKNTVLTVIDEECGNQIVEGKVERLKMYGKKLEEYFSKPRNFEEIDWYEFMKFNNIHPIITIYVGYFSKEKIEKIRDEIKPYYNQKDFTILFYYWVDNGNGYDKKYVW